MQLFRSSSIAWLISLVLLPGFFSSTLAVERKVFKNRYVVTPLGASSAPNAAAVSYDSQALASRGLNVSKNLGKSQLLITKGSVLAASASSKAEIVTYDANEDICPELINSGVVAACSPDYEVHTSITPNDTSFNSLWGLSAGTGIDAPRAWDIRTGSGDVVVAIIDTGIDYTHPDLQANIWNNPNEVAGNGIDDDGNGIIDDKHGANFSGVSAAHRGNPMDDNSHGTHVAGTIGAVGNNAIGIVGVAWQVKLLGIKFLDASGSGSLSGAIQAINYMVALKNAGVNIRVANNSWGGAGFSQPLFDAIKAAEAAGIVFTAAAGNEANDNDIEASYPASYEATNVVSVAAVDSNRNLASFSNFGAEKVDVAAPGVGILSTTPGNNYASYSGTSMATPHVSGALAVLFAHEPNLSMSEAISRLYDSAIPLDTLNGVIRTGRMLNLGRMVANETNPLPAPTPPPAACHYSMEEISFAPDTSMEQQPIVMQEDEFNYHALSLPFMFPFFRSQTGVVHISPNGVVYTKNAPMGMDYRNEPHAPLNSIAALQTDLLATAGSSEGVRVKLNSNSAQIFWNQRAYDAKSAGLVKIWLTLHSSGVIEQFVTFDTASLQSVVRKAATVGLGGQTQEMIDTFAYNNATIRNGLAIRYTPRCDGSDSVDTAVVKKVRIRSTESRSIRPGTKIGVRVFGRGYGAVTVSAAFNGQSCETGTSAYMSDGMLRLSGRLPKISSFDRFTVSVNGKQARTKVASSASRPKSRRLSASKLQSACSRFLNSLR